MRPYRDPLLFLARAALDYIAPHMLGSFFVFLHSLLTWCSYAAGLLLLLAYLSQWETDESLKARFVVPSVLIGFVITLLLLLFVTFTTKPYSYTMTYHGFPAMVSAEFRIADYWRFIPDWPRSWELLPRARLVPVRPDSVSIPGLLVDIIIWSALVHRFYIKPRMIRAEGAPDSAA